MSLGRLGINNIRNIQSANLELDPGINLFVGANGSGKTSLLEAVYFLGSGRTFRAGSVDPLISRNQGECTVFGVVQDQAGQKVQLGVQRGRDGSREIRRNGATVVRASELARCLPTLVLGPNTVDLLTGPPEGRRQFLNWGVFHVEPSFSGLWEQANRCLRQRNELLRTPGAKSGELEVWDQQLGQYGDAIHALRTQYFKDFEFSFSAVAASLSGLSDVRCVYNKGWEGEAGLNAVLSRQAGSDLNRGYTQAGYHRADLRLTVAGELAARACSRGELKVLAWSLLLTQGKVFQDRTGAEVVYLVDDLVSELDSAHRRRVCDFLSGSGGQVLVTGIDRYQLDGCFNTPLVFHVEQGRISAEERVNERR